MITTLLMASLLSAAPTKEVYVTVDMLRVREAPGESATPKGKLRINTAVRLLEEQDGWSRVQLESRDFEGWALSRFLGPEKVSAEALKKQLAEAKGAARVGILERLVALEPNVGEHYRGLQEAYQGAGNTERAGLLAKRIKGDMPVYFAGCAGRTVFSSDGRYEYALVVGSYRKGRLTAVPRKRAPPPVADAGPTAGPKADAAAREEEALRSLAADLSGVFWSRLKGEGTEVESGTPFPEPSVSELEASIYGPTGESHFILSLGPCSAESYWVSAPVEVVTPTPSQKNAVTALSGVQEQMSTITWIRPVFGDGSVFSVVRYSRGSEERYGTNEVGFYVVRITPDNKRHVIDFTTVYEGE
jgi:uncharacterized protein YgiM (DUF1202 family)